jgi:hypothetical protein
MELRQETRNTPIDSEVMQKSVGLQAFERHYTVSQLSKLWFFSESTIRRLFIREPGVIKIVHQRTRMRRGYTSLRIPEPIAQRVHRRLQGLSS